MTPDVVAVAVIAIIVAVIARIKMGERRIPKRR
jgi:hypothetical protein